MSSECPACHRKSLGVRERLRVAARAGSRCPACGVALRFAFWPRVVHVLFGDAVLLAGVVGGVLLQSPVLIPFAASSWITLALFLPLGPAPHPPLVTSDRERH